jgi:hypothetical protein
MELEQGRRQRSIQVRMPDHFTRSDVNDLAEPPQRPSAAPLTTP